MVLLALLSPIAGQIANRHRILAGGHMRQLSASLGPHAKTLRWPSRPARRRAYHQRARSPNWTPIAPLDRRPRRRRGQTPPGPICVAASTGRRPRPRDQTPDVSRESGKGAPDLPGARLSYRLSRRFEMNAYVQDDEATQIGSGLSNRCGISVARSPPRVWALRRASTGRRKLGETAHYARAEGEDAGDGRCPAAESGSDISTDGAPFQGRRCLYRPVVRAITPSDLAALAEKSDGVIGRLGLGRKAAPRGNGFRGAIEQVSRRGYPKSDLLDSVGSA